MVYSIILKMACKRKLDSLNFEPPAKMQKTNARNFKESWKVGNDWLTYEPASKSMTCKICIKTKRTNIFNSGCTVLKKENVTKHSISKGMYCLLDYMI